MPAPDPSERSSGVRVGDWLVGRYRIERRLGHGGMGTVWLARHGQLGFHVAVKVVWPDLLALPAVRQRVRLEAEACARIDSPHVVRLLDHGETARGVPFLVFEYLRGESLAEHVAAHGPLPPAALGPLAEQLGQAVASVHRCGVVHGDLKPDNVMWLREPNESAPAAFRVKLIDFGIASVPAGGPAWIGEGGLPEVAAAPGARVGTPQFMSPEQLAHGAAADPSSDRWTLAVSLCFAATGQMPFAGASVEDITRAVCELPPPRPSALRPSLGPAVDRWFARACAKAPPTRFAAVDELVQALCRALEVDAAHAAAAHSPLRWVPSSLAWRRGRGRSWRAAMACVVGLGAACGSWWWWG